MTEQQRPRQPTDSAKLFGVVILSINDINLIEYFLRICGLTPYLRLTSLLFYRSNSNCIFSVTVIPSTAFLPFRWRPPKTHHVFIGLQ